jgi:hypothetical protein
VRDYLARHRVCGCSGAIVLYRTIWGDHVAHRDSGGGQAPGAGRAAARVHRHARRTAHRHIHHTLDFFIVNVAIPGIQADLRAGATAIQWVVAGFGLALGGGLITGGRLGDLFGRRRMYALVLDGVADRHAASAAGVLSTAQQVGNALGGALVGIAFYGSDGVADAFRTSLLPIMAFCGITAALAQLLPGRSPPNGVTRGSRSRSSGYSSRSVVLAARPGRVRGSKEPAARPGPRPGRTAVLRGHHPRCGPAAASRKRSP